MNNKTKKDIQDILLCFKILGFRFLKLICKKLAILFQKISGKLYIGMDYFEIILSIEEI